TSPPRDSRSGYCSPSSRPGRARQSAPSPGCRVRASGSICRMPTAPSRRGAGGRRTPSLFGFSSMPPMTLDFLSQCSWSLECVVTGGAAGTVAGAIGLSLDEVVSYRWEATLAGEMLSARELVALARLKAPLVRFRGQWVAVDPKELEEARRLLAAGGATLAAH